MITICLGFTFFLLFLWNFPDLNTQTPEHTGEQIYLLNQPSSNLWKKINKNGID